MLPPPLPAAALSALHVLGVGLAVSGVALRARALARGDLPAAFRADNAWGIAALVLVGTGLARAFLGVEKGADFYLHSAAFWVKMGIWGLIFAIELLPMVTLIQWRRGRWAPGAPSRLALFARLSQIELALVLVLPFVAAAMARGVGR